MYKIVFAALDRKQKIVNKKAILTQQKATVPKSNVSAVEHIETK